MGYTEHILISAMFRSGTEPMELSLSCQYWWNRYSSSYCFQVHRMAIQRCCFPRRLTAGFAECCSRQKRFQESIRPDWSGLDLPGPDLPGPDLRLIRRLVLRPIR